MKPKLSYIAALLALFACPAWGMRTLCGALTASLVTRVEPYSTTEAHAQLNSLQGEPVALTLSGKNGFQVVLGQVKVARLAGAQLEIELAQVFRQPGLQLANDVQNLLESRVNFQALSTTHIVLDDRLRLVSIVPLPHTLLYPALAPSEPLASIWSGLRVHDGKTWIVEPEEGTAIEVLVSPNAVKALQSGKYPFRANGHRISFSFDGKHEQHGSFTPTTETIAIDLLPDQRIVLEVTEEDRNSTLIHIPPSGDSK